MSRKIEKLTTRPAMIANGRRRPPLAEPAKMSGVRAGRRERST
jgi:hypothetical protein